MFFKDRRDAGKKLAKKLISFKGSRDAVILGLPRGGVIIADEAAKELGLPLDLIIARKIGAPGNEEFAIGAITETGDQILDENTVEMFVIPKHYIEKTVKKELAEAKRRAKAYRGGKKPADLNGKTAIIIDDGIATGMTMKAAIRSARKKGAKKIIAAVPIAAPDSANEIKRYADETVFLHEPYYFSSVGSFYNRFEQTSDKQVINIMKRYK